jgi:trimethylamine:corrinoid methyltransferase-like protein
MNEIRQAGRRGSRARDRQRAGLTQLPWRRVTNPYPPMEIVSADQLEAIHETSLQVLEEIGLNFLLPEAREILREAGAEVEADGPRVRFDRALIEAAMARAVSVSAGAGQQVQRGDRLFTIEAMKVETAINAEDDGEVEEVVSPPGTRVDSHDLVLVLKPI